MVLDGLGEMFLSCTLCNNLGLGRLLDSDSVFLIGSGQSSQFGELFLADCENGDCP